MTMTTLPPTGRREWIRDSDCDLDAFRSSVDRATDLADYPLAHSVEQNVLLYSSDALAPHLADEDSRRTVQTELVRALTDGPGIVVFRNAFRDASVLDRATEQFDLLIARQRASGEVAGDHFGKPGANDRIWNAAQKLALSAPDVFADYYANDILALICQSWLGPLYQVTSQVNVVNPGGTAQVPHRDYHLGIVPPHELTAYPAHLHRMSATLTLQGAVAHCDMPVASGPTSYLPYSHQFEPGYVAFSRPEFVEYFRDTHVQLPLRKGDAVFFNPALYHGAGQNRSERIRRMANLLQVSSPFGRAMEVLDREAMSNAVYPTLLARQSAGAIERTLRNVVVATAECYPFPTNLDHDQPVHSPAPATQVDTVWEALQENADPAVLAARLSAQSARRQP
ncbi:MULTISPECIES: phytanoyl-CoA dioxygenase family protein [unclassified Rhodococcus (in: high G+C Gram-positive bacteria)]|uniref:phytanoyl-CoA dioxygenase family protein n=1 Tax=unclassified Rhodococcus (in: high G+C Gram-positive bacteria) TaxID=192944 RepID=UPI00163A6F25|nr:MULTISPECIES: phytanoyl-CoA dioxygenase family protein [unclassified Rhodococcus (in: high G+C Gram-positive bacteria)]MBC2638813.1 phytanoyl-CoA dioxygenase family protein [Rhodococcus sp. 3A]MBC2896446.1 phytanoyl-CoA dioxygenase family protein [Rhodococcus sp. 4CII]